MVFQTFEAGTLAAASVSFPGFMAMSPFPGLVCARGPGMCRRFLRTCGAKVLFPRMLSEGRRPGKFGEESLLARPPVSFEHVHHHMVISVQRLDIGGVGKFA